MASRCICCNNPLGASAAVTGVSILRRVYALVDHQYDIDSILLPFHNPWSLPCISASSDLLIRAGMNLLM